MNFTRSETKSLFPMRFQQFGGVAGPSPQKNQLAARIRVTLPKAVIPPNPKCDKQLQKKPAAVNTLEIPLSRKQTSPRGLNSKLVRTCELCNRFAPTAQVFLRGQVAAFRNLSAHGTTVKSVNTPPVNDAGRAEKFPPGLPLRKPHKKTAGARPCGPRRLLDPALQAVCWIAALRRYSNGFTTAESAPAPVHRANRPTGHP